VVTSQDSAALHRALEATGTQIGKHLILKHRAKPYVNADLFENYIRTVFLPHFATTRIMQNIPEEDAVLLMDHRSPHLTPVVIGLLSNACVRVVTFAPHTTQIFQVLDLDLALFGVFKRRRQYQLRSGDDTGSARFIKKVYHDFRSTMTDINRWGAFRGIGLTDSIVDAVQCV
jgi:hypothetical protein